MTLEALVGKSGDSRLLDYRYANGRLFFTLAMEAFDAEVPFEIETDQVRAGALGVERAQRQCRIELLELAGTLKTEDGRFVPAAGLPGLMRETSSGASLAYGLKASEAKWVLNLRGSTLLLSCLLAAPDKIRWTLGSGA